MYKRLLISTLLASSTLLSACLNSQSNPVNSAARPAGTSTLSASEADMPSTRFDISKAGQKLTFRAEDGSTVLESLPIDAGNPSLAGSVNEPLGGNASPEVTQYSGIVFEVGGQTNPQWPAGPWTGNILTGASAGLIFRATGIVEDKTEGTVRKLVLSTNDPSGRTIRVATKPAEMGSVEVSVDVEPAAGVSSLGFGFAIREDEAFYGFGGRHNVLNQRGNDVISYIQAQNIGAGPFQPGVSMLPGTMGDRYQFPSGPDAAYYVQAGFVSNKGYTFFLDESRLAVFRMGAERDGGAAARAWRVAVTGASTRYLVAAGDLKTATAKFSGINGRHRTPPEWALGPVLSRTVRTLGAEGDDAARYMAKVKDDLQKLRTLKLPVKGYAFEGWDILPREFTKATIDELHRMDLKVYLYIRNYVGADIAATERPETFAQALQNGYLAKTPGGAPYLFGSTFFVGLCGVIDFTNPQAVKWWTGRVNEMLNLGADGFMQDFGENVFTDMQFADGSTGVTMHNEYPNLFHRTTRKILDDYTAKTGRDIFFFTRAGFSGRDAKGGSSASFENSNFPGDETTDWSRASGLASLTTNMLNRATGGAWGFNTDIGGYIDLTSPAPTKELFIRWTQWAALSPVFRVHNSASQGVRMPWSYDAETLEIFRQYADLHQRASPYIIAQWKAGQSTGLPPTRPLWLMFPGDKKAEAQDQMWMLGDDVLVAPIVTEGSTAREVYFPQGCWEDPVSQTRFEGPRSANVVAPLNKLPYFFRCGSKPF